MTLVQLADFEIRAPSWASEDPEPRWRPRAAAEADALALPTTDSARDALNARCAAWLVRIAAGDEAAFAEFYRATSSRMWTLAVRVVGRRTLAEDVLAELYLQVWRTAASYAPERAAPLGWLSMLCRSRAIDHLRRSDRAESSDNIEALADSVLENDVSGAPSDDDAERAHDAGRLDAALARLPALRRQMVALAYFRGLSHSELAAHFDLPLGTVKSHMRGALAELRRMLEPEVPS